MFQPILAKIGGTICWYRYSWSSSIVFPAVFSLSLMIPAGTLQSQSMPNSVIDPLQPYARAMQVAAKSSSKTSFLLLPLLAAEDVGVGPWASFSSLHGPSQAEEVFKGWWSLQGRFTYRTGYPSDRNDGALWQGKGVTTAFDLGTGVSWGSLSGCSMLRASAARIRNMNGCAMSEFTTTRCGLRHVELDSFSLRLAETSGNPSGSPTPNRATRPSFACLDASTAPFP